MQINPTKLNDGSILLGVVYDCAGFDLLVFPDVIRSWPGTHTDAAVARSGMYLVGKEVIYGSVRGDIPALGAANRPEAQRLAQLLIDPPTVVAQKFNADGQRHAQQYFLKDIASISMYKSVFALWRIFIEFTNGNIIEDGVTGPNDFLYVEALLKSFCPNGYRRLSGRDYRIMVRKTKMLLRDQRNQ